MPCRDERDNEPPRANRLPEIRNILNGRANRMETVVTVPDSVALLRHVLEVLEERIPPGLKPGTREYATQILCAKLRAMSPQDRDFLVYGNPRDPMCRRLADWWEEHQILDEDRLRQEAELENKERDELARLKVKYAERTLPLSAEERAEQMRADNLTTGWR